MSHDVGDHGPPCKFVTCIISSWMSLAGLSSQMFINVFYSLPVSGFVFFDLFINSFINMTVSQYMSYK